MAARAAADRPTDAERGRLWRAFVRMHGAACDRARIPDGPGAKARVAKILDVSPGQYGDALTGRRGSYELLLRWAHALELRVETRPDGEVGVGPFP